MGSKKNTLAFALLIGICAPSAFIAVSQLVPESKKNMEKEFQEDLMSDYLAYSNSFKRRVNFKYS